MSELAKLLEELGHDPGERIPVALKDDVGTFRVVIVAVSEADAIGAALAEHDCWYGAAPLHSRVAAGKGHARDVVGVRELYADLDVKPGGMPTYDAAADVIDDLSAMLGTRPVAVVQSGHGLQPHWAVERGDDTDWPDENDPRHGDATALLRRWGRLVRHVAERHGGSVDGVFNLDRILRAPGTTNRKDPDHPVRTTIGWNSGGPVTLTRVAEALMEYGVKELPGDRDTLGEVVSEPGSWTWADSTCGYVAAMVTNWGSDKPSARHPWLVSQATRLAAAHRNGCITQVDYQRAAERLTERFRWLLANTQERRDEAKGEITDTLDWGVERAATRIDEQIGKELGGHAHDQAAAGGDEFEAFWSARDELKLIRTFARARMVSPWATLGTVLARVVAAAQPFIVLPPPPKEASLNLFIGLVGLSGDGKGAAEGVAAEAVQVDPFAFQTLTLGSGQGIAHAYMRRVKENGVSAVEQHTTSVLFTVQEIDMLAGLTEQKAGSTLTPTLRNAYMGERLGHQYADPDKRLPVPEHKYRLCLVAGVQPGRAGVLLNDADGGTPQRFLWLPTTDPQAPGTPPDEPQPVEWKMPSLPPAGPYGRVRLPVCQTARTAIAENRRATLLGQGDPLNGHGLLARLKVAAALGLLNGHLKVTDDDWALARTVVTVSDQTRALVAAALSRAAADRNRARGEDEAERAVIVEERAAEAAIKRACGVIMRKLHKARDWVSRADLRSHLGRERHHFGAAIERLLNAGQIETREGEQGGRQYRAVEDR